MNYGKYGVEHRLKSLHPKSGKYISRLLLNIFKTLFVLFLFLAVVDAPTGFGMIKGTIGNTPPIDILNIQSSRFTTAVYDSTGDLTDTLVTSGSNREEAIYEEPPRDLVNASAAIEGSHFWIHSGVDTRSIARAVKDIVNDGYVGGGGTIIQQPIKNSVFSEETEFGWGARIKYKLQEQYLAVQLEKNSDMSEEDTKKLIITNYLDTINLGNNTLGAKMAAKRYLDKDVSGLTLPECTVLAFITRNPSRLDPISGHENNAERWRIVLQYMYEQDYTIKAQQEEALAGDVYDRIQNVDTATKGINNHYSYFTDGLIGRVINALMKKLDYTGSQASNLLYSGGLQIYTAQDPTLQAVVDEGINNPGNYSVAKYPAEYGLSITHVDDAMEHYSEENLCTFRKSALGDSSLERSHASKETAQDDADQYKAWLLKDGGEIIGERQNLIPRPQTSLVLLDQHTDKVKTLCGGRGERIASFTLNRAGNVYRQPGSAFEVVSYIHLRAHETLFR